jgi:cell wall-associated NlpC family hydrolase
MPRTADRPSPPLVSDRPGEPAPDPAKVARRPDVPGVTGEQRNRGNRGNDGEDGEDGDEDATDPPPATRAVDADQGDLPEPGDPAPTLPATGALTMTALELLGTPYRSGGSTPKGFDCSGFTQWVFARHGLLLPRDTRAQFEAGDEVDLDAIEAGDLVFFRTAGRSVSHVAIALDRDRFVHAPTARGVVRIESLSMDYWSRRVLGARRFRPEGDAAAYDRASLAGPR